MARYIAIVSGKGGVGKTTTTINLGVALSKLNQRTVVVDTNLVTPNVSLQLGLPPTPANLNAVLKNKAQINDVITYHESGISVVPAGLSVLESTNNNSIEFEEVLAPLAYKNDIVLLDCAAGLWGNIASAVRAANEVIVVTNPELTALVDALKSIKMVEKLGVSLKGIVLNRVVGASHEVKEETIEGILSGYKILAKIPYDKNVLRCTSMRKPIVHLKPYSPASRAYRKLATELIGLSYKEGYRDILLGTLAKITGI